VRAVVIDAVQAQPEVREVAQPTVPAGGVVRVMATGMCRSDWHAWAGHDEEIVFPHVPGHELAGMVAEVGAEVRHCQVGDRVTVPFVCGCGRCEWCRAGEAQVCPDQQQPGFNHWGSFAEYVALHAADDNLVAIPEQIDFPTAASLGCRFATAYRALVGRARVSEGEWVTVVGAGGVGLSTVMIARALGGRVVVADRNRRPLLLPPPWARNTRCVPTAPTSRPLLPSSPAAAATSLSMRWAVSRPVPMRSSAFGVGVATSRLACCRRSAVTRGCRWRG
jgi:D-arabinose 1-dehydrogenase-like Zn-dependent alcohol dehydrogenase